MVGLLTPAAGNTHGLVRAACSRAGVLRLEKTCIDLSLVLPTYNERENLQPLFEKIDRALANCSFEVIVVDDDSPDRTWAAAQELQEDYPWLCVIRRRNARGLSSAVVNGLRHCRGRILGVMDADLQHDVNLLPALLEKMESADFAIATRRAAGGSDGKWSPFRRFGSRVATKLARFLARVPFSDPMSGFFLVRRELFESIDNGMLRPRGYKILVYLYASAVRRFGRNGVRFCELGYEFANRIHGRSKVSPKVALEYILMLMELRLGFQLKAAWPRWVRALF